jgi:hypothetical protein
LGSWTIPMAAVNFRKDVAVGASSGDLLKW